MIRTDRCTTARLGREHFQEAPEGNGVRRESARSSLRTGGVLSPLSRAVPPVTDQPRAQRFPASDEPHGLGVCSAVTRLASLTLPRPLSTDKTINTVARRLPLLAQRSAHPVIPIPQGPIARHPSRPCQGVRLSESPWGRRSANGGQRRGRVVDRGGSFASTSILGIKTGC